MATVGLRNKWTEDGEVARSTYTITNGVLDRTFDANAAADAEICDVLFSLITDLAAQGLVTLA